MGGKPAPFGIDEEHLESVIEFLESEPAIELCGIHIYAGTQILDCAIIEAQYKKALEIAESVAAKLGRPLHTIDFGGGFGIPYFANETDLDLLRLRESLADMIEGVRRNPMLSAARLIVEPGRFLVGEGGVYVARITDIKVSRGKKFLVVDGGLNHHLAASGNLGQTIKRNYPIGLATKLNSPAEETVDIVGPLCTPLDTLARGLRMPKTEIGDLVAVFQSGAYARTASPLGFLSHPAPPEVWILDGKDTVIRNRGGLDHCIYGIPDETSTI
jgi:diaminopimelate decarboxylase